MFLWINTDMLDYSLFDTVYEEVLQKFLLKMKCMKYLLTSLFHSVTYYSSSIVFVIFIYSTQGEYSYAFTAVLMFNLFLSFEIW